MRICPFLNAPTLPPARPDHPPGRPPAKAKFTINLYLKKQLFHRFLGYPFRAFRRHNFKLPPPHRNTYYPLCPGGGCKVAPPRPGPMLYVAAQSPGGLCLISR